MNLRALFAASLLVALPSAAIADAPAIHPFTSADVFALEWASDPQIAPDGSQVAYVRRSFDIRTDLARGMIWLVSRDGTSHRPLTGSTAREASPRWSPDGTRLAYVSGDAEGGAQIFVKWLAAAVTTRVTNLTQRPSNLAWSPDGRTLAFVMRVPVKREPLAVKLLSPPGGAKWADPVKAIDRVRCISRPLPVSRPLHGCMKLVFISIVAMPVAAPSLRAACAIATSSSVITTPPCATSQLFMCMVSRSMRNSASPSLRA